MLSVLVLSLACLAIASSTAQRMPPMSCQVGGRYAGFGSGTVEDVASNTTLPFQGVGILLASSAGRTVSGDVYAILGSEELDLPVDGTFTLDRSAYPCRVAINITQDGVLHQLRGFVGNRGVISVVDTTEAAHLAWEWYPAPKQCNNASAAGSFTGIGVVQDTGSGDTWAAVAAEAVSDGKGNAELAYVLSGGGWEPPVQANTTYSVDRNCSLETSVGFRGAVFNWGFTTVGLVSSDKLAGGVFFVSNRP